MRIAHLLTVVEGVSQGVCMCSGVCVHGGVQRSVSRGVCPEGDVCPGEWPRGCVQGVYTPQTQRHIPNSEPEPLPRWEQNDWQTNVKTLPYLNFVCGR